MTHHLAIDIGASSGRHVLGTVQNGKIVTQEVYRFENSPVWRDGHLCWELDVLFQHIQDGMTVCREKGLVPDTMAIDTWAVDFALLNENGNLVGDTVAYRDSRTKGMDAEVERVIPFGELYTRTGIQKQPFNTIYQLVAIKEQHPDWLERAQTMLMVPDYLNYLLTGKRRQEYTNATTTALVGANSKTWDEDIIRKLDLPARLFGPLSMPGETVGRLTGKVQRAVGFDCTVLHAASHDTASAFMAVPAESENAAYLSSGTWSLLGTETMEPVLSDDAQSANFTNEGGYAHRYRFLKNIMGLWMVQSIRRDFGKQYSYVQLEAAARKNSGFPSRVDVNDDVFLAPETMVAAIQDKCRQSGQRPPEMVGEVAACVYNSLSDCYAASIRELEGITGKKASALHIVGGGSKDGYLNSLTAKKTGLPVYAGPTEGTALGNLMAQMIAVGTFRDLVAARCAVAHSFPIQTYTESSGRLP